MLFYHKIIRDKLFAEKEMKLVKVLPMKFDSFYVSLLSEKYKKSGIFGMLRAFFIGCLSNLKALRNTDRGSSMIYEIKKLEQDL